MRCDHCPVSADRTCPAVRVPRYCVLVDPDSPAFYPAMIPRLIDRSMGIVLPAIQPNPHLAHLRAVKSCHHRHDPKRCGCSQTAACDIGLGDLDGGRTATLNGCLRCPLHPSTPPTPAGA